MLFNRCGVARGKLLARHARDGGAICDSFFLILPVYSTLSSIQFCRRIPLTENTKEIRYVTISRFPLVNVGLFVSTLLVDRTG